MSWFVFDFAVSFVAQCCRVLSICPIKDGLQHNSVDRVVMGDMYRSRNDMNKLRHVQCVESFELRVFFERGVFLSRLLRGRCCTQSTDSLALVVW